MVFKMHCSYCVFDKNTHKYLGLSGYFTENTPETAMWFKRIDEVMYIIHQSPSQSVGFEVAYSFS